MAGLIQQNMQPPAVDQQAQAMPGEMEEEGASEDTDPNFAQALEFAMQAIYKNGAAKDIAVTLTKANDITEALANTSYEITSIVDERTEGAVPDELFAVLATKILQEVADIAEAAGIKLTGSQVATAMKTMILRYVGENGMDTTQLQAAMDEVDPAEFDKMAEEDGAPELEEVPA